ncbi:MAG: DNA gyrase inhibitor YacG [Tabrizicola sp.]|nr:DNA gyrase inhibitor YacG [Tabrizicola sp.]
MSCPTCGKEADAKYRPFCSRRCADVDLARWLNESYRIAAEIGEDAELPDTEDGPPRRQ